MTLQPIEQQQGFDCDQCEAHKTVMATEFAYGYITWVCTECLQESYELVGEDLND